MIKTKEQLLAYIEEERKLKELNEYNEALKNLEADIKRALKNNEPEVEVRKWLFKGFESKLEKDLRYSGYEITKKVENEYGSGEDIIFWYIEL